MTKRSIDWRWLEEELAELPEPLRQQAIEHAHLRYTLPAGQGSIGRTGRKRPPPDEDDRRPAEIADALGVEVELVEDAQRRSAMRRGEG